MIRSVSMTPGIASAPRRRERDHLRQLEETAPLVVEQGGDVRIQPPRARGRHGPELVGGDVRVAGETSHQPFALVSAVGPSSLPKIFSLASLISDVCTRTGTFARTSSAN